MNKERVCAAAAAALMLLTGCASKTPTEPAAEPVPEIPVLEAREVYQLAEIPVQELHDGDEVTVDGVCTFTVKGFGAGKTITADGLTCAGAKAGQTLVWVTCDYVNLKQDEVSPGRLVENAVLRLESGSSDGKSASFAQILHGEPAEIYIYYAIPEDLPEQSLTTQFTIDGQTYSYEIPVDRAGALPPTLPEPEEEPKEDPETGAVTLQEPQQEPPASEKHEEKKPEEKKEEKTDQTKGAGKTERTSGENGGYILVDYDGAGRVVKRTMYSAADEITGGYANEYDSAGFVSVRKTYGPGWEWASTETFDKGNLLKMEMADGSTLTKEYDENGRATCEHRRGPRWGDSDYKLEYNELGQQSRGVWYSLDGTVYRIDVCEYDANGALTKITNNYVGSWEGTIVQYFENGKWVKTVRADGSVVTG